MMIWRAIFYSLLAAVGLLAFAYSGQLPFPQVLLVLSSLLMLAIYGAKAAAWFIRTKPPSPLRAIRDQWAGALLWGVDRFALFFSSTLFFSWLPPIKMAIPDRYGFWADMPIANAERAILGRDAWQIAHMLPNGITRAVDLIYASWLLAIILASLGIAAFANEQRLARYFLGWAFSWCLLGIVGAHALASAGPIFGPDLGFGFEGLHEALRGTIAMRIHDALWAIQIGSVERLGGGISAAPSMHCALTIVFALTVRDAGWKWPAIAYAALIWFGSIYLGWHYAIDGLISLIVIIMLWPVIDKVAGFRPSRRERDLAPAFDLGPQSLR